MNKNTTFSNTNKVLAEISGALVGQLSILSILNKVVETSMNTLHAEVCSIFLEDKKKEPGIFVMMAGSGFAKKLVGIAKYKIGEGFTGGIIQTGNLVNIKSREELENFRLEDKIVWSGKHDDEQWAGGKNDFRNLIAIPLKIKQQTLGIIKIENKIQSYGSCFTNEDVIYLETITNVVSLVIENNRLHEEIEKEIEKRLKKISGSASHRIKNHVTAYSGIEKYLQLQLKMPVVDKIELEKIIITLVETTKHINDLASEFTKYAKPYRIEPVNCSINKIITDEVWLAQPPDSIKINIDKLDNELPEVSIDKVRFAEAIKELLKNSLKAINKKSGCGEIIITTKYLACDKYLIISICDNGCGFPEKYPIFEPFNSTYPDGTGLGLVTVKELIEAHGGKIEAFSIVNGGTTMKLIIPC